MSTAVAIVKSIVGQVVAVSPEGVQRVLIEGDRLFAGEQVVTGAAGAVTLELTDGRTVDLGRDTQWSANTPDSTVTAEELAAQHAQAAPSVNDLQQAIAAGADPTKDLEAPAAGPNGAADTGGEGGGGHTFVLLEAVGGAVNPTIGFPTAGFGNETTIAPLFVAPNINTNTAAVAPAPVITGPTADGGTISGLEDNNQTLTWAALGVEQTTLATTAVVFTALPAAGTLEYFDTSTNAWTALTASNAATLQFTQAQFDAGQVRFVPEANASGSEVFGGSGLGNLQDHYAQVQFTPVSGTTVGAATTLVIDVTPVTDPLIFSVNSSSHVVASNNFDNVDLGGANFANVAIGQVQGQVGTWSTSNSEGSVEVGKGNLVYGTNTSSQVVELEQNVGDAGTLTTTIDAKEGAWYTISLDYSARYDALENSVINVYWGTTLIGQLNSSFYNMNSYSFQLPAGASGLTDLTFVSGDANSKGGVLDNIVVTESVNEGNAGTPILLSSIEARTVDTDTSETWTLTLSGLPAGSTISDGTAGHTLTVGADGSVVIPDGPTAANQWDTTHLLLTTPAGTSGSFTVGVTFTSQDAGSVLLSASDSLTLVVHSPVVAPEAAGGTISGTEDTALTLTWAAFGVTDTNTNAAPGVIITKLPTDGVLQYQTSVGWATVTQADIDAGKIFTKTSIDNGGLRFVPDANESGDGSFTGSGVGDQQGTYAQIQFQAVDSAQTSAPSTVNIDITPVTDPLIFSLSGGGTVVASNNFDSVNLGGADHVSVAASQTSAVGTWSTENPNGLVEVGQGNVVYGAGTTSQVVELEQNAGDASNLTASFATKVGATYLVSVDYSPRVDALDNSVINVLWNGTVIGTLTATSTGMQTYTFEVPSSLTAGALTFQAADANSKGGVLDNITVTEELNTGVAGQQILLQTITAGTVDTDGSEVKTLTISGLPEGSVITDGTAGHTLTVDSSGQVSIPVAQTAVADSATWNLANLLFTAPANTPTEVIHAQVTYTAQDAGAAALSQTLPLDINVSAPAVVAPPITLGLDLSGGGLILQADFNHTDAAGPLGYADVSLDQISQNGAVWTTDNVGNTVEVGPGTTYGLNSSDPVLELEQNSGDAGNLQTVIAAREGATYTIAFDYSPRQYETSNSVVLVYWGDTLIKTLNATDVGMQHYTIDVPQTSTGNETLTFVAGDGNSKGGLLDNIVVTEVLNTGAEDQPILLSNIQTTITGTTDPASLTISGLPEGAVLSNGTDQIVVTATGSVAIPSTWDTSHLLFTGPANESGTYNATVTASVDGVTASQPLTIVVNGVADAPVIDTPANVQGDSGTDVAVGGITVAFADNDGSESHTVVISGVPSGVTLTDGTAAHTYTFSGTGTGSVDVDGWNLANLTVAGTSTYTGTFDLTVTGTATELANTTPNNGDYTASTANVIEVTLSTPAPVITLSSSAIVASADFDNIGGITSGLFQDVDVSRVGEGNSVWTTGNSGNTVEIAEGNVYGLGTTSQVIELEQNAGDASNLSTVIQAEAGATYTVSFDFSPRQYQENNSVIEVYWGTTLLGILNSTALGLQHYTYEVNQSTSTDTTLTFQSADSNSTGGLLDNISVTEARNTGLEDQPILLSTINVTAPGASQTLALSITGLPEGSIVADDQGNSVTVGTNGIATLGSGWDTSHLLFTAPTNYSGTVNALVVAALVDSNGNSSASSQQALDITVKGVADAPAVNVEHFTVSGVEGTATDLGIMSVMFSDNDGSETHVVTLSGIPSGVTLVDGQGHSYTSTDSGTHSTSLAGWDLTSLQVAASSTYTGSFALTLTGTATELSNQDTAHSSVSIDVTILAPTDPGTSFPVGTQVGDGTTALEVSDGVNGIVVGETNTPGDSSGQTFIDGGNGDDILIGGTIAYQGEQGIDALKAFAATELAQPVSSISDTALHSFITSHLADVIQLSQSSNPTSGGISTDIIHAGDGNNILIGQGNSNVLVSGSGNDILVAGGGDNTLTGGSGADTFVFTHASAGNSGASNVINDFNTGEGDKIDLSDLLQNATVGTIDNYLKLTDDGNGGAVLNISSKGGFNSGGAADVTINLVTFDSHTSINSLVAGADPTIKVDHAS